MMPELQVVMALGFVKPKSFLVVYSCSRRLLSLSLMMSR